MKSCLVITMARPRGQHRRPQLDLQKIIILNTQFLVFDTQFLVFDAQFLVFDTQFLVFDAQFLVSNTQMHQSLLTW